MASTSIQNINSDEFDTQVLHADRPVLVDFWAGWCQPCHMLAPTIEELAARYDDRIVVAKVDIDTNPDLAEKYAINSIPTVLVFSDGALQDRIIGVQPDAEYEKALDAALGAAVSQ